MKNLFFILSLLVIGLYGKAQIDLIPDFKWGNSAYFNLNVGDKVLYNSTEIELLNIYNHYNTIRVGKDTVQLKVSRRTLPVTVQSLRLFVADNRNVKNLTSDSAVHGLLTKDALICISDITINLLEQNSYVFPISFNNGFLWGAEEDSYMFSFQGENNDGKLRSYSGIGIGLSGVRIQEKDWIVALENSSVVWIEEKLGATKKEACILLKSTANSEIYYVYDYLNTRNILVRDNQKLIRGELLATAWGDKKWEHVQLAVVKSDSVPSYENRYSNCVNFFPQLFELYFKQTYSLSKVFTKGKIDFGYFDYANGNRKNISAIEEYSGKGWLLGKWCLPDKVDYVLKKHRANARLSKILFQGTKARCQNPNDFYDYEINAKNGVYRIRAKVGDIEKQSWQKVCFEGREAATYSLEAGQQKWTPEKVVKVNDRKLTVRIYVDPTNKKVAGISEIVFQQAY